MRTIRFMTLATTVALAGLAGPSPALLAQPVDLDLALLPITDGDNSEVGFSVTGQDAATGAALAGATVAISLIDPAAADAPDEVVLSGNGKADFEVTAGDIDACRSIVVKAVLQQASDTVETEICPAEGLVFGSEDDATFDSGGDIEFGSGSGYVSDRNPRGKVLSLVVGPETVVPGDPARGRVELEGMEITTDDVEPVTVSLESDDPSVATVPAEISTNRRYASFMIETATIPDERTVTITATNRGTSASATLTVRPLSIVGLVVDPSTLPYRKQGKLTVRLDRPAPSTTTVALSSSHPDLLDVPDQLEIARGRRQARAEVTAVGFVRRQVRVVVTATVGAGEAASTKDEVVLVTP